MHPQRLFSALFVAAGLSCLVASLSPPARADVYPLILRGKVVMKDGSVPPKSVAIMRICSDESGSAPGPITDKKGEYIWRMDVDPMRTRVCHLEAAMAGYVSSRIDISALNGYTNTSQTLPDIVLSNKVPDPYTIVDSGKDIPGKSAGNWKAAMKAVDEGKVNDAIAQLEMAVKASPKFAQGWHALGILYQNIGKQAEAKDAWQHAVDADPKLLPAQVALSRICARTKDWQCAMSASEAEIKGDVKKTYTEVYLHEAAAQYGMKNYDAAVSSAQEALKLDATNKRAEYIIGRALEAKGDVAGAREHMTKYTVLDPNAADIEVIKKHIEYLGTPEAATVDPDVE